MPAWQDGLAGHTAGSLGGTQAAGDTDVLPEEHGLNAEHATVRCVCAINIGCMLLSYTLYALMYHWRRGTRGTHRQDLRVGAVLADVEVVGHEEDEEPVAPACSAHTHTHRTCKATDPSLSRRKARTHPDMPVASRATGRQTVHAFMRQRAICKPALYAVQKILRKRRAPCALLHARR